MATYPSITVGAKSVRNPRDGREEDTVGDGTVRVRKLYADQSDFTVVHPALNATDTATLLAFYAANGTSSFDFVWPLDGLTYTVRFGKNAISDSVVTAGRREYTVRLVAA